jgi:hypothetical protein
MKRKDKNKKMPVLCGGLAAQLKSRAIDKEEGEEEERVSVKPGVTGEGPWHMYNQDMKAPFHVLHQVWLERPGFRSGRVSKHRR